MTQRNIEKNQDTQPFIERELKAVIKQEKNRAPGKTPYIQMIKRLSSETMKYLLDLYNKIWKKGLY